MNGCRSNMEATRASSEIDTGLGNGQDAHVVVMQPDWGFFAATAFVCKLDPQSSKDCA